MLKLRSGCYQQAKHALRDRAAEDLATFRARAPAPLEVVLSRQISRTLRRSEPRA
jgi:hypothetical protein